MLIHGEERRPDLDHALARPAVRCPANVVARSVLRHAVQALLLAALAVPLPALATDLTPVTTTTADGPSPADAGMATSGEASQDPVTAFRSVVEAAVADTFSASAGDAFRARLPVFSTAFGPPRDLFVLEGDLLADADDVDTWRLQRFHDLRRADADPGAPPDLELKADVVDGLPSRWPPPERTLRYAVLRASFPDEATYAAVVADMAAAAADWAALCPPCGIAFEHRPEHDGIGLWSEVMSLSAADALRFIVVHERAEVPIIASAFFPTDTREERILRIFPRYFQLTGALTGRGVLRHELGHVLGYRHEHIDAVIGCAGEDGTWQALTPYDPKSVMHYFCGGGGSRDLAFSDADREGHRIHYGSGVTP
ncbi:hypothetical protein [Mongoliimonas terrestris]|uniref:hypothetical protein n=1 Tax=Mongoliimonas terrestris TaxID=1709001 RepID=UPI00094968B3|nr:hypothetical protein [Mongoliimonas terrestris]